MAKIFHVIPFETWLDIKKSKSEYIAPESLQSEGFIHCCKADQLNGVILRFFSKCLKLYVLRINESNLKKDVIYEAPVEAPNSGQLFPHYYGKLPVNSVEKEFFLKRASTSEAFSMPEHLLK